jgi:hypothetical protein
VQDHAARAKGAKCIERAWHGDVETRLDVADRVGRDDVRDVVGRTVDADAIAHVEEPLPRVVREEASDVGRTTRRRGLLETHPLPLERRHVRRAPLFVTTAEAGREELTDQATPLPAERGVVDEHAAFVDEEDPGGPHERCSAT